MFVFCRIRTPREKTVLCYCPFILFFFSWCSSHVGKLEKKEAALLLMASPGLCNLPFPSSKGALERGQYPGRFMPSSQRCKKLPCRLRGQSGDRNSAAPRSAQGPPEPPALGAHAGPHRVGPPPAEPSKQRHLLAGAGAARVLARREQRGARRGGVVRQPRDAAGTLRAELGLGASWWAPSPHKLEPL